MPSDALAGGPDDGMTTHAGRNEHGRDLIPEVTACIVHGDETLEAPAGTAFAFPAAAANHSRQCTAEQPTRRQMAGSSLVRRLVRAKNDPAKQRIRSWLGNMKDGQLLSLGVTSEEIATLRRMASHEVSKR
jgi:hypothetical protein